MEAAFETALFGIAMWMDLLRSSSISPLSDIFNFYFRKFFLAEMI